MFGVTSGEFENCVPNGIIDFGKDFSKLRESLKMFLNQARNSDRTPLVSALIEGKSGSGKTSIASALAMTSKFPFVRIISPEKMVGLSEAGKCSKIAKIFTDSYRSSLSLIVIDDIERLLEYVPIGPRFSNVILQTLMILVKKMPPVGHKSLIIGTTSDIRVIVISKKKKEIREKLLSKKREERRKRETKKMIIQFREHQEKERKRERRARKKEDFFIGKKRIPIKTIFNKIIKQMIHII
jgi:vesicle-fusing ATPase